MPRIQRPSDQSYLSVNWQNPIDRTHPLNRDLRACWLLRPGAMGGRTVRDLMGDHDGTLVGADHYGFATAPPSWGAILYDGANDYTDIGNSEDYYTSSATEMTVSVWFLDQSSNSAEKRLMTFLRASGSSGVSIGKSKPTANKCFGAYRNGAAGFQVIETSTSIDDGEWHCLAYVLNGANAELYLDGVSEASASDVGSAETFTSGSFPADIGAFNRTGYRWDGLIGSCSVWDRALSGREVADYHDLSQVGYPGLLNRWRTPHVKAPAAAVTTVASGGGRLRRKRHPSDQSYLSVDWQNPIDRTHPLNQGLLAWWLIHPGNMGGALLRDLLSASDCVLTNMDPSTDWVNSAHRPGSWGGLDFDGANDHVAHSGVQLPKTTGTLSYWATPNSVSSNDPATYYEGNGTGSGNNGWGTGGDVLEIHGGVHSEKWQFFYQDGTGATGRVGLNSGVTAATNVPVLNMATWNRAGEIKLYLNGAEKASADISAQTFTSKTATIKVMGRVGNSHASRFWNGQIDDVRIYDRELNATEAEEYYQLSRQGYPGLLNRWRTPYAKAPAAEGEYLRHTVYIPGRQLYGLHRMTQIGAL